MKRWKIAGINFEHFHMGDNLRWAAALPNVQLVGVCHDDRRVMDAAVRDFQLHDDQVFTDYRQCLEATQPDLVIACPAAASHGDWAERLFEYDVHVLMEKPLAASLAEADRMQAAARRSGKTLAINWPIAWYPTHQTAYRLIREGQIGTIIEVHYYDGNRGPLWHSAGKLEKSPEEVAREKPSSWFYQRSRGGGSLLDYLGYGTTLGTWFNGGQIPIDVTAVVDRPPGLEVDEHAIVVARYSNGLSKFETRWGTFTDPWTHQPQPKCGFVVVGDAGTLSCYDYEPTLWMQTPMHPQGISVPVDSLSLTQSNPIAHLIDAVTQGRPLSGPMAFTTCRIGQQIIDTAVESARQGRTLPLMG